VPDPAPVPPEPGRELHLGPVTIVIETPSSAGSAVRFRFAAPPGPVAPGLHVHPHAAERIEVQRGAVLVRRRGSRSVVVRPGEHATIPAGTPHDLWAVRRGTRGTATITPAIAIDETFAELDAELHRLPPRPWELARIVGRHLDHTQIARIPLGLQRRAFRALALGRA
jgi:mannose-6-phosphate isomerase-like protein (cupin superfamily)